MSRPRFAAEERIGTLVLQACSIRGAQIDTLRNRMICDDHQDKDAMKGRWPVARALVMGAAQAALVANMNVVALPRNDEAIPQVLGADPDANVSTVVITDDGKAWFELRGWVGIKTLVDIAPPFTVKESPAEGNNRIIVQPIAAFLRTVDMAGHIQREMLMT